MKKIAVVLKTIKTRHLICKAKINNVPAVLLIDTGASNSCIDLHRQDDFQLKSKGEPFDAAGASQDKMKAIASKKSKIIVGRHRVGSFSFVLLDLSHINKTLSSQGCKPIDGILGADFLRKKKAIINYESLKMWL